MVRPHLSALAICSETLSLGFTKKFKGYRFPLLFLIFLKDLFQHLNLLLAPSFSGKFFGRSENFHLIFHSFYALCDEDRSQELEISIFLYKQSLTKCFRERWRWKE